MSKRKVGRLPPVASLASNSEGRRLIIAWASGKIQAINVAEESVLRTVQAKFFDPHLRKAPDEEYQKSVRHHRNAINSICFSPDGQWLASASDDYTVKLTAITRAVPPITLHGHLAPVMAVRYSPDGEFLVTASRDGTARLWEAASGQQILVLRPELDELFSVAFSQDSQTIAIGGSRHDGTGATIVYRRSGPTIRRRLAGHLWSSLYGIAFHPTKELFATTGGDQEIIFRDSRTGARKHRIGDGWLQKGNRGALVDIAISPGTGDLIAVAPREIIYPSPDRPQDDYNIYLWRWKNWKHTDAPQVVLKGHQKVIRSFAFAPLLKKGAEGNMTSKELVAGDASGVTIVWNLTTGKQRQRFDDSRHGSVLAVAYLNGGTKLLTAHEDGYLAIRNVANGKLLKKTTLGGRPTSITVTRDGQRLIAGTQTGGLVVVTLSELITLSKQVAGLTNRPADSPLANLTRSGAIERIALTADGHLAATASGRSVTLWDLKNYKKLCTLPVEEAPIHNLAFDPHSGHLIVCGKSDLVSRWDINTLRRQLAKVQLDWE